MRLLVRLPLVLVIVLGLSWAGVLMLGGGPEAMLARSVRDLGRAFPGDPVRQLLLERARQDAQSLLPSIPDLGGDKSRLVQSGLIASGLHLDSTLRVLPVTGLLVLAGLCAGLVWRERMRYAQGYASPTATGLARASAGAGIFWMALFALSPIPVSHASLYLASGALSLGGMLYVANLPLKL